MGDEQELDSRLDLFGRERRGRARRRAAAVEDEDVETAERGHGLLDERLEVLRIGQVTPDAECAQALRLALEQVAAFLEQRLRFAVAAGVPEESICLDPGIGFGKTPDQNLELVRRLDAIVSLGRPVLVGLSRKSTVGKALGDLQARIGTDAASVGAAVAAFDRGASIFRAHDVRAHVEALAAAAAVERGAVADR